MKKQKKNPKVKYDIFISYRRKGGWDTANALYTRLRYEKGYQVFLDVDEMRAGDFNAQLYTHIEQCKDFLVVLSPEGHDENGSAYPHCLTRCNDSGDWFRKEIMHAKQTEKNIIPIMLRGFNFPEIMPDNMEWLKTMEGIQASPETFSSMLFNLSQRLLLSEPKKTRKSLYAGIGAVFSTAAILILLFFTLPKLTGTPRHSQPPAVTAGMVESNALYQVDQDDFLVVHPAERNFPIFPSSSYSSYSRSVKSVIFLLPVSFNILA